MGPNTLQRLYKIESPIEALKEAFKQGELTLYLGAGASVASGLPTWERLIQSMYFKNIQNEQFHKIQPFPNYLFALSEWLLSKSSQSLEVIARKTKSHYSEHQFHQILKETLYAGYATPEQLEENYDSSKVLPKTITDGNPTMKAVVELCKKSNPGFSGVESIITYNYDNLLELALEQNYFKSYCPIWKSIQRFSADEIPIFHVHGFIPIEGNGSDPSEIVLSEEHYNRIAHDAYFWGNLIQMQYLGNSVGLMIGLSLADRNIRRLLDAIRNSPLPCQNFILLKEPEQLVLSESDIEDIDERAQVYLVRFMQSGGGRKTDLMVRNELQNIINEIYLVDKLETEKVLEELRVKPIWYKSHNEIPDLLNQIIK